MRPIGLLKPHQRRETPFKVFSKEISRIHNSGGGNGKHPAVCRAGCKCLGLQASAFEVARFKVTLAFKKEKSFKFLFQKKRPTATPDPLPAIFMRKYKWKRIAASA